MQRSSASLRSTVFERQLLHLVYLSLLLAALLVLSTGEGVLSGSYLGLSTAVWFWLSIAFPIAHQFWVLFCWRLELHHNWLSGRFGEHGFRFYAFGFALFAFGRIYTLIALAVANRNTLVVNRTLLNIFALVATVLATHLFYSVARYFTFRRALGIDHFDSSYRNVPFVREGIFRFTRNGMYTFGLLALWLPGLLYASKAALLSAAFSHLYVWVHYFCTELPDIRRIYAAGEVGEGSR